MYIYIYHDSNIFCMDDINWDVINTNTLIAIMSHKTVVRSTNKDGYKLY